MRNVYVIKMSRSELFQRFFVDEGKPRTSGVIVFEASDYDLRGGEHILRIENVTDKTFRDFHLQRPEYYRNPFGEREVVSWHYTSRDGIKLEVFND